jgi:hypothetical protein
MPKPQKRGSWGRFGMVWLMFDNINQFTKVPIHQHQDITSLRWHWLILGEPTFLKGNFCLNPVESKRPRGFVACSRWDWTKNWRSFLHVNNIWGDCRGTDLDISLTASFVHDVSINCGEMWSGKKTAGICTRGTRDMTHRTMKQRVTKRLRKRLWSFRKTNYSLGIQNKNKKIKSALLGHTGCARKCKHSRQKSCEYKEQSWDFATVYSNHSLVCKGIAQNGCRYILISE